MVLNSIFYIKKDLINKWQIFRKKIQEKNFQLVFILLAIFSKLSSTKIIREIISELLKVFHFEYGFFLNLVIVLRKNGTSTLKIP